MENSSYVDKENIAERLERLHDKIEGLKVIRYINYHPSR
jgi:uncharacterized protein HemX